MQSKDDSVCREETVRDRLSIMRRRRRSLSSLWRYAVIRLLCIVGIHSEGIVVSGNLGCCTLCGEDTYAVFIVRKLERNAHGRILPRH